MSEKFYEMASLGLAVALSPELLLIGLWLASSRERGRQKAWSCYAGGVTGLLLVASIGFALGTEMPAGPSWPRFAARSLLSLIMLLIGLHVLIKKPGAHANKMRFDASRVGLPLAFFLGAMITSINIKATTLGIAAGKELHSFSDRISLLVLALAIFVAIGSLPMLIPAAIETMRAGISNAIMDPCYKFAEKYGKWIVAVICFLIGFQFLKHAIKVMP